MSTSDGKVIGATKIVDHGPDAKRWVISILAEGYQTAELPTFATDAQAFADYLKGTAPFDALWSAINVYRVDVSSTDSGADDPTACGGTGATPKTYFDATFCTNNLARLLSVNKTTALSVTAAQVPHAAVTLVIVNSTKYGGSGGAVATYSKAPQAIEIGIHEMGHTAFGLADEYNNLAGCTSGETGHDSYTGTEPKQPNVTKNKDKTTIKWKSLIDAATAVPTTANADCSKCDSQANPVTATTVGAFEGAFYFHCGAYRPQYDCRMNTLGKPFCAVCAQAITTTISPFKPKAPAITAIAPTSGSAAGGTAVTITGTDFTGVTKVSFGASVATFTLVSDTKITATSPAGAGTTDIQVVTPAGSSASVSADRFTYTASSAPTPTSPTPTRPTPTPTSPTPTRPTPTSPTPTSPTPTPTGTGTSGHAAFPLHEVSFPQPPQPEPFRVTGQAPASGGDSVALLGVVGLAAVVGMVAATGVVALVAIQKEKP